MNPDSGLLEAGVFSIPEAAYLVGASQADVRIWVEGKKGRQYPLIENELGRVDGKLAISFKNLMEIKFIAFFSSAGVSLHDIRAIMDDARRLLNEPHPFATSAVFRTDGKRILAEIAKENGIESLFDLRSQNYEMKPIVLRSLKSDVIYDPSGAARVWYPRRKTFPNVVINPLRAFGRPILRDSSIPTAAVANAFRSEKDAKIVALQFEVPYRQAREAFDFETHFRKAA
jgi:uncharacterized protein (DUF433 family)